MVVNRRRRRRSEHHERFPVSHRLVPRFRSYLAFDGKEYVILWALEMVLWFSSPLQPLSQPCSLPTARCFFASVSLSKKKKLSVSSRLHHLTLPKNGKQQKTNNNETAPSLPPLRWDRVDRRARQRAPHEGGRDLDGFQGPPRGPRADPEGV